MLINILLLYQRYAIVNKYFNFLILNVNLFTGFHNKAGNRIPHAAAAQNSTTDLPTLPKRISTKIKSETPRSKGSRGRGQGLHQPIGGDPVQVHGLWQVLQVTIRLDHPFENQTPEHAVQV